MMLDAQFIKFLFAGGVAAAGNFGSRFFFSRYLDYEYAIVIAYFVGMTIAFILMKERVFFNSSKHLLSQILRFSLVNVLAIIQTLMVSLFLAYWLLPKLGISANVEGIAHFFGVLVPVITSFFAHKHYTFR